MKKRITLLMSFAIAMCINMNAATLTDIDISSTSDATALETTITNMAGPSRIILKPGFTYNFTDISNVGYDLHIDGGTDVMPTINLSNFDIVDASNLELLKITNCKIVGDVNANYLMNISTNCSITNIDIDGCNINNMRGILRIKGSGIVDITNLTFNNCTVNNVGGYGFINHDNANAKISNTTIKNSTITNCTGTIYRLNKPSIDLESLTITNCTFNNNLNSGTYVVDMKGGDSSVHDFTNGITVINCIFGTTLQSDNKATIRVGTSTTLTYTNCYKTTESVDFTHLRSSANGITEYSGSSVALFTNTTTGDYTFKDAAFEGKDSAGDPRWRSGQSTGIDTKESTVKTLICHGEVTYSEQMIEVNIYSVTGNLVKKMTNTSIASYNNLNNGIYVIVAKDQNGLMKINKVFK